MDREDEDSLGPGPLSYVSMHHHFIHISNLKVQLTALLQALLVPVPNVLSLEVFA